MYEMLISNFNAIINHINHNVNANMNSNADLHFQLYPCFK